MIKICDEAIVLPLLIIFKIALQSGIYPNKWKKANVVPVHQKDNKHLLKNYRPISLLPICGKIFEKCTYHVNLVFEKKIPVYRNFFPLLTKYTCPSLETQAVFLDISKPFDRVWHKRLLFKLES